MNMLIIYSQNLEDAPLAVMVWFHGGGYTSGANIQYPGHFLAAKGVIVVVPNYRLNSFGKLRFNHLAVMSQCSKLSLEKRE